MKKQQITKQQPRERLRAATGSRFRIVGNYLYAPVESRETFASKEEAQAENRRWTKEAEAQGLRWKGRIVTENAVALPTASEPPPNT